MPHSFRTILGISDLQIQDLFQSIQEIVNTPAKFTVTGISDQLEIQDERLNKLIYEDANVIKNASASGQGFSINFTARSLVQNDQGHTNPHPYYSTIGVNINDWYAHQGGPKPDEAAALQCNILIGKFLRKHGLDAGILSNEKQSVLEPHLALISRIEASSTDQIIRINKFFVELTEKFDARNVALTEQIDARRDEIEKEYLTKYDQLEGDKEQLENLKKELDDRTNTHARRAIRGELITTLKNRQDSFSISRDTKSLRWPIHTVFMILLGSTFAGALWSLYVWGINPSDTYGAITLTSAIKSVVFTFGFLTTAGLYVSWMNRWFDKHADAQFQTKQFEIDINRASWAVEAALEWKGVQGEQMPDVLLAGITKHLFEISIADSAEYSPLEALATSILGSASNLNLDLNGSKLTLDRKSLKEIRKSGP